MSVPPSLPPDSRYAGNYCEENIYHLAEWFLKQTFIKDVWDIVVVFISNEFKAVRVLCVIIIYICQLIPCRSHSGIKNWDLPNMLCGTTTSC